MTDPHSNLLISRQLVNATFVKTKSFYSNYILCFEDEALFVTKGLYEIQILLYCAEVNII